MGRNYEYESVGALGCAAMAVVYFAVVGLVIYAFAHFITKFW